MKYVGSKGRHAKQILPIILANRKPGQAYVEPFVGGANTMARVDGRRIGGDLHPSLINMLQAVSSGWMPFEDWLSEENYRMAKDASEDGLIVAQYAFLGFSLSYGGKWFGGYRRDPSGKRDYAAEAMRAAEKEFPKLRGVEFYHCSYDELPIPAGSIIYCDPPYAGVMGYTTGGFDHAKFWQWCRDKRAEGHTVFVSEYAAPDDFICVWSKPVNNTLDKDTGAKRAVERLFTLP